MGDAIQRCRAKVPGLRRNAIPFLVLFAKKYIAIELVIWVRFVEQCSQLIRRGLIKIWVRFAKERLRIQIEDRPVQKAGQALPYSGTSGGSGFVL